MDPRAGMLRDLLACTAESSRLAVEHRQKVESHVVYIWLAGRPGFAHALKTIERKARDKRLSGYRGPHSALQLISIFAYNTGWYVWDKRRGRKAKIPGNQKVRQAAKLAARLASLIDEGVSLPDSHRTMMLHTDLLFLAIAPSQSWMPKERADSTWLERHFLDRVAQDLKATFAEASPTLVACSASVAGFTANDTTIKRILRENAGDADSPTG
jgi:hypothetical protein